MQLRTLDNPLGETVLEGRHPSGLRIYLVPKAGYSKTFGVFSTNFGSIDNRFRDPASDASLDVPDGVAHFLEHKLFEDQHGDVSDRFSALGASCNAFTSFVQTSYLFSTAQNEGACLDLLVEFVSKPWFTAELIAKEQGIIAQEIRMYDDDPSWRSYFDVLQALYPSHPVRLNIAGSVESIARIDADVLYACHRAFYRPANMALTVAGGFDRDDAIARIERGLAAVAAGAGGAGGELRHERRPDDDGPPHVRRAERTMDVARPKLLLGFRDLAQGGGGREVERREILGGLLLEILFGRSSPVHDRLYREGLIDDTFSAQLSVEDAFGFVVLGGDTDAPDALDDALRGAIRQQVERGIDARDFERIRRKSAGRFVASFNSPEAVAHAFAGGAFRDVTPFQALEILEAATVADVDQRMRELFRDEYSARSVIQPGRIPPPGDPRARD